MGKGKEATTVRQLILVVVLVAASFLGGAFVNGPGLQWVQTRVLRSLGLNNGGEITSVDLKSVVSTETSSNGSISTKPEADTTHGPPASIPSLLTENEVAKQDTSDRRSGFQARGKSTTNEPAASYSQPSPSSSSAKRARARALAQSPGLEHIPSDPDITPASAVSPPVPAQASSRSALDTAPAIIDSFAALLPSNAPSSDSSLSLASSTPSLKSAPKSIAGESENWAILERKMQSLGVSRYMMDGEPGSRVVFSCLIPLAGRQAVSQRFEAEGDDMVHATQAALRRIALWRATQPSSQ
jgi:hypothetical protein